MSSTFLAATWKRERSMLVDSRSSECKHPSEVSAARCKDIETHISQVCECHYLPADASMWLTDADLRKPLTERSSDFTVSKTIKNWKLFGWLFSPLSN